MSRIAGPCTHARHHPGQLGLDEDRESLLYRLLADSHAGDARAFQRLYEITSARVLGIIHRTQRERAEADEVLQEVYLKVWNARSTFDATRGGVEQWLARIARNSVIDSIRRRGRRPSEATAVADEDVYEQLACGRPGPLELAMHADRAHAIRRYLRDLGADQRQVLALAFWHDLSHDEIAKATGHPLGTIKSRIRRSLHQMRGALASLQA